MVNLFLTQYLQYILVILHIFIVKSLKKNYPISKKTKNL